MRVPRLTNFLSCSSTYEKEWNGSAPSFLLGTMNDTAQITGKLFEEVLGRHRKGGLMP